MTLGRSRISVVLLALMLAVGIVKGPDNCDAQRTDIGVVHHG